MAANQYNYKIVVWERSNKLGKWLSYPPDVCKYLEENFKKNVTNPICLGDVDKNLKIYSVNISDMMQVSEVTGTKLPIRRKLCDNLGALARGFSWQWLDDDDVWNIYDADMNDFIDTAFLEGKKCVSLQRKFGYPYEINFAKMMQVNKRSKRKRKIQRCENTSSYPIESRSEEPMDIENEHVSTEENVPEILSPEFLAQEIPGTSHLLNLANAYKKHVESSKLDLSDRRMEDKENETSSEYSKISEEATAYQNSNLKHASSVSETTVALVYGKPYTGHKPPHTPNSELKPVPGIEPLPRKEKPKKTRGKKRKTAVQTCPEENDLLNVFEKFTKVVELSSNISNETCIICCESLSSGSSYNDDKTLLQLTLCSHIFHKACLEAMYESGNKEFLQCPSCKQIHGEKCGIQPPGEMIYHVLPYSLPSYPECDTIRIIYDIHSGIQGPEHPNPGRHYTARGFPRHCYLPDNEMGRKILRLLIKAWKRRLIFTIGRSSTTGEENTVTWNEIHHKTEFGCNRYGHGYPDPNYFKNVLAELEAHGITDDEVRVWIPV